jgi:hypothetical protein
VRCAGREAYVGSHGCGEAASPPLTRLVPSPATSPGGPGRTTVSVRHLVRQESPRTDQRRRDDFTRVEALCSRLSVRWYGEPSRSMTLARCRLPSSRRPPPQATFSSSSPNCSPTETDADMSETTPVLWSMQPLLPRSASFRSSPPVEISG